MRVIALEAQLPTAEQVRNATEEANLLAKQAEALHGEFAEAWQ